MQVDARVTAVSYATQELSDLEHFIRTSKPSRPHAEALTVRLFAAGLPITASPNRRQHLALMPRTCMLNATVLEQNLEPCMIPYFVETSVSQCACIGNQFMMHVYSLAWHHYAGRDYPGVAAAAVLPWIAF